MHTVKNGVFQNTPGHYALLVIKKIKRLLLITRRSRALCPKGVSEDPHSV